MGRQYPETVADIYRQNNLRPVIYLHIVSILRQQGQNATIKQLFKPSSHGYSLTQVRVAIAYHHDNLAMRYVRHRPL